MLEDAPSELLDDAVELPHKLEPGNPWTPEMVEDLTAAYYAGLSAGQTQAQLSAKYGLKITRNMVTGQWWRRREKGELAQREEKHGRPPASREELKERKRLRDAARRGRDILQRQRLGQLDRPGQKIDTIAIAEDNARREDWGIGFPINQSRRKAAEPLPDPAAITATACDLFALTKSTCRYPVGEATGIHQLFCGKGKLDGIPYCRHHARIAYTAPARAPSSLRLVFLGAH